MPAANTFADTNAGFNGGSALNASIRSMYAAFNTNVAASFGVLGWVLVDFVRTEGTFSVVSACEGAIAGLVGITPVSRSPSCRPSHAHIYYRLRDTSVYG